MMKIHNLFFKASEAVCCCNYQIILNQASSTEMVLILFQGDLPKIKVVATTNIYLPMDVNSRNIWNQFI